MTLPPMTGKRADLPYHCSTPKVDPESPVGSTVELTLFSEVLVGSIEELSQLLICLVVAWAAERCLPATLTPSHH